MNKIYLYIFTTQISKESPYKHKKLKKSEHGLNIPSTLPNPVPHTLLPLDVWFPTNVELCLSPHRIIKKSLNVFNNKNWVAVCSFHSYLNIVSSLMHWLNCNHIAVQNKSVSVGLHKGLQENTFTYITCSKLSQRIDYKLNENVSCTSFPNKGRTNIRYY